MLENISNITGAQLSQLMTNLTSKGIELESDDFKGMLTDLINKDTGNGILAGSFGDAQSELGIDAIAANRPDGEAVERILMDLIESENANQFSTNEIISGNIDNIDGAMIDMNEMNIAVQFTMQVRNKIVEAYQEIMRMQV